MFGNINTSVTKENIEHLCKLIGMLYLRENCLNEPNNCLQNVYVKLKFFPSAASGMFQALKMIETKCLSFGTEKAFLF